MLMALNAACQLLLVARSCKQVEPAERHKQNIPARVLFAVFEAAAAEAAAAATQTTMDLPCSTQCTRVALLHMM
jgi:hypothetical protein